MVMIAEDFKYYALSSDLPVGGPTTWYVTDWDQRRTVAVTMDGEVEDDSIHTEHYGRYSSQLSADIFRIYLSPSGDLTSTSSDPKDDQNHCVHYPFLRDVNFPEGVQTISREELEEIDRLGANVDLVSYPPSSGPVARKVVFKYYFHRQYAEASWKEMNLWMRLPQHPNIVPFDRVVIDEYKTRVLGFTNLYIPGGTLEEDSSRVFKLKWLQQLIDVVDLLNLHYDVAHQDIAPRNLVVDEVADRIRLFDFNFAARIHFESRSIDGEFFEEERNDVKGVFFTAYEIITRDESLRSVPHEQQKVDSLRGEWKQHPSVKLDHPVSAYQDLLHNWRERRATLSATQTPEALSWPARPKPEKFEQMRLCEDG